MLDQVMKHYGLVLDVAFLCGGFLAFLSLPQDKDNHLICSSAGESITDALLKLECNLANINIEKRVGEVKQLVA